MQYLLSGLIHCKDYVHLLAKATRCGSRHNAYCGSNFTILVLQCSKIVLYFVKTMFWFFLFFIIYLTQSHCSAVNIHVLRGFLLNKMH